MTSETRYTNLTRYEDIGLNSKFNLADGHAHQGQNPTQREIVASLPELFHAAEQAFQSDSEREFQQAFYSLAGQHSAIGHPRTLLCYSASLSTDLAATYLASRGLSVALLQPCFDNLATILRRRNVALTPLGEDRLRNTAALDETLDAMHADAVFLTLPNNPTGFNLTPDRFRAIVDHCVAHHRILILDCTFRFFDISPLWDQYEVLEDSGVSYLVVEDSGKTWPTQDLKCSILAVSRDLYAGVLELHDDILLNVSPFILRLLTAYIRDTQEAGLERTVWRTIRRNRQALREALAGTILTPEFPDSTVSVDWLRINRPGIRSEDVVATLGRAQIGVLPGDHFHWADHEAGARFIRIALARPPEWFATACGHLRDVVLSTPGFTA
ncbi:pyridoxal phosphate-dependent aminotransferase [Streptomyces sp. NPDC029006]|uniref:pyridoxal phosphate-dependent aminotransferase n=1 Tax=Streptomyces sp. NPDC029006 TaxID=3155467 RepID=UPI0033E32C59